VSPACRVPPAYLRTPFALRRTRHLIARGRPVHVLVIGPPFADPVRRAHAVDRLQWELERRLPQSRFIITDDDSAVGPAAEVVRRLEDEVLDTSPDLVIWQVGTWDAIAGSDPEALDLTLRAAAGWLHRHFVDLVLVDPPFVPQSGHEDIYWPVVGAIGHAADRAHINLLRWYAMLQYWDIANRRGVRRQQTLAAKHGCAAELLAEAIARGVAR
jgi:hypothetical protein